MTARLGSVRLSPFVVGGKASPTREKKKDYGKRHGRLDDFFPLLFTHLFVNPYNHSYQHLFSSILRALLT